MASSTVIEGLVEAIDLGVTNEAPTETT